MRMEAAGGRLSEAGNVADRVAALREIEAIAAAHPEAEDARILARVIGQQAIFEAGPTAMIDALGVLAGSGEIGDVETYAAIIGPMIDTVAQMQENHTILPSIAIELDDAISNLEAAADKVGLPSIAETLSEASGMDGLGASLTDTLGALAKLAELAKKGRNSPDIAAMDEASSREFVGNLFDVMTLGGGISISAPMQIMVRDTVVWNQQMFNEATKALDLVGDAIETGRLDQAAFDQINRRLNELKRGPWGSETAKDILKSICESIPFVGKWCGDAFNLVEVLMGNECAAITCDCANVGGGLMRGALTVTCRIQEENVKAQCAQTPSVVGYCDPDARGPGATN